MDVSHGRLDGPSEQPGGLLRKEIENDESAEQEGTITKASKRVGISTRLAPLEITLASSPSPEDWRPGLAEPLRAPFSDNSLTVYRLIGDLGG